MPSPLGGVSTFPSPTDRNDRVAETAAMLILSPIFEADLQPEQYAYRQGRNAHDAVRHIQFCLEEGANPHKTKG